MFSQHSNPSIAQSSSSSSYSFASLLWILLLRVTPSIPSSPSLLLQVLQSQVALEGEKTTDRKEYELLQDEWSAWFFTCWIDCCVVNQVDRVVDVMKDLLMHERR